MGNETKVISDKEQQKLIVEREFEGPVQLIWRAWTEPELVKKWWGPKGFIAPSIQIDLRVGGTYVFCMRGPGDREMFTGGHYREIIKHEKISVTEYMSNAAGEKLGLPGFGPEAPSELSYTLRFQDLGKNRSKVSLEYDHPGSTAHFEAMLNSGMEKGWSQALEKMAEAIK